MFTAILAIGTIILQLLIVIVLIALLTQASFLSKVAPYASLALRIIFVGAIAGSLLYEYGFGYAPCLLCWYQRIAIFGIGILAFTGNLWKSALLRTQVLLFASGGFLIAFLHNYIDIFPSGLDVCGATGPSCLMRYVHVFGYITIPMMSATVLLAGILLPLIAKSYPQASIVETAK
ncbi:MAG TPA: disulfide bond formation protein B [Candidatus Paceibacterota bacterium]|nr:disulfide bond formation protein B [Candidatus Paceibacterota bacterium]